MQITGTVHEIGATIQKTDSFKTRDLIVEYAENPQYPEYIRFEANQDRCALLDNYKLGDRIEVDFNLKGRPWTNREGKTVYFNSLVPWKFNKVADAASQPQYAPPVDLNARPSGDEDDMPF